MWIKICGNTSLDDTLLAVEAGADAVGFVFAPSPRQVTLDAVSAITPVLPARVERIGVFVNASFGELSQAIRRCELTGVQLHAGSDPALTATLRQSFGATLRILRVVHYGAEAQAETEAIAADPNIDAVLIDSRTATALGGTGISFDWKAASNTLFNTYENRKMIAAGGLKPGNVAEAIRILKPWGVDVASGVEMAPGRKDPAKVKSFILEARAAQATL